MQGNPPKEIRHKDKAAIQDGDDTEIRPPVVLGDFAGELIKPVAELVGGRGGGRADFAQAGGTQPDKVDAALALVAGLVAAA